jgi:hypothetical protein
VLDDLAEAIALNSISDIKLNYNMYYYITHHTSLPFRPPYSSPQLLLAWPLVAIMLLTRAGVHSF